MRARLTLVLLLSAIALTPALAQGTLMRYRWTTGKPYRLLLNADLKGSLPILGSDDPVDLEAKLFVVYRVTPKRTEPDGSTVLVFKVENAEADVAGIPLPIPMEDAAKVLDRTVTFAPTGAVLRVEGGGELPFALSIPGVDPQRLYSLVCPVVFPEQPVAAGDRWPFESKLLGEEGAPAHFSASVVQTPTGKTGTAAELRVTEEFSMDVDQALNAEKKPVAEGEEPARTRKGSIKGNGVLVFDPGAGGLLRGWLKIDANIAERVLAGDGNAEPRETLSKVEAVIRIQPQAIETKAPAKPAKKGTRTRSGGRTVK